MSDVKERTPIVAPGNSHEAAAALDRLDQLLEHARTYARQYGTAADRAEHLYRRESARAGVQAEGRNAEERAAHVHLWRLDGPARLESSKVSEAMGLDGSPAETVGELRWLRDRALRLAEQWSATAYDRRSLIGAWMTVASMAKSEAELSPRGTP